MRCITSRRMCSSINYYIPHLSRDTCSCLRWWSGLVWWRTIPHFPDPFQFTPWHLVSSRHRKTHPDLDLQLTTRLGSSDEHANKFDLFETNNWISVRNSSDRPCVCSIWKTDKKSSTKNGRQTIVEMCLLLEPARLQNVPNYDLNPSPCKSMNK